MPWPRPPCAVFLGQHGVVEQVKVALDAVQQDGLSFPACLLVGPPGVGKTALAKVIACEMCTEFHEVLGQAISFPADLNALLLGAQEKDVVLIDECHEMDKIFQTAFYLILDQRRVFLQGGKGNHTPQSIPIADFTILLATTDEFRLLQPLRDRMKLVLRFDFYSPPELVQLLVQRCRTLGWGVGEKVLPHIAVRSRGTPRLALRLLQSCRRVARSEGETTISLGHLRRACDLEQLDSLGIGPNEQQYLRTSILTREEEQSQQKNQP